MSELIIIQRHPNSKNLHICSGKPDTKEDVRHYYFACRRCEGDLKMQPQFWKNVSDGIDIMCWGCAEKEGFDSVRHYNMSISIDSQQLRKTSVSRGESAEPHDIGEADTTVSPPQAEAEKEKKKNV